MREFCELPVALFGILCDGAAEFRHFAGRLFAAARCGFDLTLKSLHAGVDAGVFILERADLLGERSDELFIVAYGFLRIAERRLGPERAGGGERGGCENQFFYHKTPLFCFDSVLYSRIRRFAII